MATLCAPLSLKIVHDDMGSALAIKAPESVVVNENGNFSIAERLALKKAALVAALAKFPACALWIAHKYQQTAASSEQDDAEDSSIEPEVALDHINSLTLQANQIFSQNQIHDAEYLNALQELSSALQCFKFTFEDLIELTDLLAFAYQKHGITEPKNHADLISKRAQQCKQRSQIKFLYLFDAIQNHELDPEFAFSTFESMHNLVAEIVVAESEWLHARQKLAAANSRLVLFIANQYKGGFLDFDDLVQEGQTGLLKAVDRYNHELGFQFSTYAGYWIRQAISRSLTRSERVVRLPFGQMANINKVYRAKDELVSKTGKEPTRAELAEYTSLSIDEINNILSISQTAMSFDGDSDDEEQSFGPADFLEQQVFTPAFGSIADTELEHLLNGAINTLEAREAKVIRSHFGVNCDCEMTLQEIGNELHLTRERVRQIQVAALNKIRRSFGEQLLSFL
jgi:RNA polymerase primary sigma factor